MTNCINKNCVNKFRPFSAPSLELNGIVFTMVNGQARLTQDVINEVRNHFGEKVYETTIPRNVRVSEAPSMGTPVVFLDPRSKGAESYKAFAWEFMAKNPTRFDAVPAVPVASAAPAEPVAPAPAGDAEAAPCAEVPAASDSSSAPVPAPTEAPQA